MAVRRHVIAARNTTPEAFAAALAGLNVSEVEEANGWCWAMASVWTTGAHDLVNALETFDGPYFLVTTEDASRWRFHLRKKGLSPFDTVHEFQWIRRESDGSGAKGDWADLVEEDSDVKPQLVEFPSFPPLPTLRLEPLDFEDEFFAPYADDGEEEESEWKDPTPLEYIVESYADNGFRSSRISSRPWRGYLMRKYTLDSSRSTPLTSPRHWSASGLPTSATKCCAS